MEGAGCGAVDQLTDTAEVKGKGPKDLVKVTLAVDGKKSTRTAPVTATEGHPFWSPQLGTWLDASGVEPCVR
ncbi:hypothetical protein [Streptomyces alboflavus]|uniref:hypothetical protein n=1 Tax=Streptomyces alboflavus TaxID=67267 RepID=UPI0004C0A930|nr:hypothetical protein [Streptomyces alboflavus]